MMHLLFLFLLPYIITASSSNYHAYNYDTATQFTPDGRLLQVEYASHAATHSSPAVIMRSPSGTIIMALTSSLRRLVSRIHILDDSNNAPSDYDPVRRPGAAAVVVLCSGVLSDALALLGKVDESQRELGRMYGLDSPQEAQQVANSIATACQRHAFGGGLRPYGATMTIVDSMASLQTDPSGAITNIDDEIHVVGGTEQTQLKKTLDTQQSSPTIFAEALVHVAKALVPKKQNKKDPHWLEVVVLSPDKGAYRLDDAQIQKLLDKVQ